MSAQSNAAPIIIKRKKVVGGGGHHGGAWKVAYADFVTAMMAFFLLMWLLGATTEKQRKGVAEYFSPSIPISPLSGGGDGAFGGDSAFSENTLTKSGTGAAIQRPTESERSAGPGKPELSEEEAAAEIENLQQDVEKALSAFGGESMTMESAMRHVVTKVTDEGLVIEIFDLEGAPLFQPDSAIPNPVASDIADVLAEVLSLAVNQVAVNGHVKAYPITMIDNPAWDLSSERAKVMRQLVEGAGLKAERVQRTSGFADRKPVTADPSALRNNRIEFILLRRDR